MRQFAALPSLVALFFAPSSLALGLGSIQLHSALGQPLQAEIPINVGQNKINANEMQVKVSMPAATDDLNGSASAAMKQTNYQAKIVTQKNGKPSIQIISNHSLDAPYVRLMVDLKTPKGKLSREYTLLLDPPEFASQSQTQQQVVAINSSLPEPSAMITEVAPTAPVAVTTSVTTQAITAPVADVMHSNSETSKTPLFSKRSSGKRIATAPTVTAAPKLAQVHEQRQIQISPQQFSATVKPIIIEDDEISAELGLEYGPTEKSETLWSIIQKLPKYQGVSPAQMQYAILQHNPDAFISGNMNGLKPNMILSIPSEAEVKDYAIDNLNDEISVQATIWSSLHQRVGDFASDSLQAIKKVEAKGSQKANVITQLASLDKAKIGMQQTASDESPAAPSKPTPAQSNKTLTMAQNTMAIANVGQQHQFEQSGDEFMTLINAMQRNIKGTVNRLNALQDSQGKMFAKASTMEAKQQNLENSLEMKAIELAQVEKRLQEFNQQLTLLQQKLTAIPGGQTVTAGQEGSSWTGVMTSILGFGVLAGSLLGGMWYLRRRDWILIGDDAAGVEYEEMQMEAAEHSAEATNPIDHEYDVEDADAEEFDDPSALTPLEEAEVLMAHKRYQQAESLLAGAIKHEPKQLAYYQKLLEIYAATENRSAFDSTAQYIVHDLQYSDENTTSMINTMRAITWPDCQADTAVDATAELSDHDEHDVLMTGSFGAGAGAFTPPMAEVNTRAADNHPDNHRVEAVTPDVVTDVAADECAEQTDMDSNTLAFTPSQPSASCDTTVTNQNANDDVSDPDTALDLAKAYIELEDFDAAIELLSKVESNGDAAQQSEASELKRKLAN